MKKFTVITIVFVAAVVVLVGLPVYAKQGSDRESKVSEKSSEVAKFVQSILETTGAKGGIGEQVREIAKAQSRTQAEIEDDVASLEARGGWVKKIIGPDQQAIKNLEKHTERNQERIQELQQLGTQTTDGELLGDISGLISSLEEQDDALEEQIDVEEATPSLFGWLMKLLNKGKKEKEKVTL